MFADIEGEVVFVTFVSEEGVRSAQRLFINEGGEAFEFFLFGSEAPCVEIEVKFVVIDNELFEALNAFVGFHGIEFGEPRILFPCPDAG